MKNNSVLPSCRTHKYGEDGKKMNEIKLKKVSFCFFFLSRETNLLRVQVINVHEWRVCGASEEN